MNQKSKSPNKIKLTPLKETRNKSNQREESILKDKSNRTPSLRKLSKSTKSLHNKSSATQSTNKPKKQSIPLISNNISKQYTKSTFQRYQQKLSIQQKISQLINEISDRQSRLNSYFQIYRLLESQVGQQRCLQHNNDLSLYCLNENKVLCVHCIYGQTKHKTHKVLPLKDCLRDVGQDNARLQESIRRDIDTTKLKIKTCEMNQKFIQRHYRQELQQLEEIYVEKLKTIEVEFCEKKAYVTEYFEAIKQKNSQLTHVLKDFQKTVSIKLSILQKQPHLAKHDSKLVSRQTILTKVAQLSDLSGMALEDFDQKDIGHNCLRNRVNRTTTKI